MSDRKNKYQNILAIEGSTPVCSVALRYGSQLLERTEVGMGIHSSAIFAQISEVLKLSKLKFEDIDAVLMGIGPGSYTGLRVVASSIKGLMFNGFIPLFGVNTLSGFAACIDGSISGNIHSIIDARRNHVYYQAFSAGNDFDLISYKGPELIEIAHLYSRVLPGDTLIGTGIDRLNKNMLNSVNIVSTNGITAKGLVRVFESGCELESGLIEELHPADFEPKYSVEDFA